MVITFVGKYTLNSKEQGKKASFKDEGNDCVLLCSKAVLKLEITLLPRFPSAEITSMQDCN